MTDKMREEFEAWALKDFGLRAAHFAKDSEGDYLNYPTQCYFQVWQASREALVIELPDAIDAKPYACFEGGWNDMRDEAVEAITAAGLKVKP